MLRLGHHELRRAAAALGSLSTVGLPFTFAAILAAGCSSSSNNSTSDGGTPPGTHDGGAEAEASTGDDGGGGGDSSASGEAGSDGGACTAKTGYEQVVAPAPTATHDDAHVATVLDGSGNPMVAYVEYDMSGATLYFTAYDGATCKWKPRVKIAAVGNVDNTRDRQVTMSRDPADGHLGIGYQVLGDASGPAATDAMLAQSDDGGATWTTELVASRSQQMNGSLVHPTVAMQGGKTYYAYYDTVTPGYFHLASRSAHSGTFADVTLPPVGDNGTMGFDGFPPSLAIDASGNVGVAMFAHTSTSASDQNLRVVYYASATGKSVAVFDSLSTQNDGPDVSLVFEGTKPRIAATLDRGTDMGSKVWFSASDDGATWSMPTELPMDGGDAMGPYVSLAADGKGALTVATDRSGNNGTPSTCGGPKVSTSPDDGSSWMTCGPVTDPSVNFAGAYVQIAYAASGKRIAGFGVQGNGVWVWREP